MPFKSGLLLNMLLHIAGLLILKSIAKQLKLNSTEANFVQLMWVFSPAIISVGFWARQYELLALINLITLYCYLKTYNNKNYDSNYIQVSENGEFMISKSEVIIADKLKHHKIPYAYEYPLKDDSGVVIHPDFTIEDADTGIIYYW